MSFGGTAPREPATAPARKPSLVKIIAAFAAVGLLQIGFVFLVADDWFARGVMGGAIAFFEVVGAIVFYKVISRPPRRPPIARPG